MNQFRSLKVAAVQPQTRDSVSVVFDVPQALRDEFVYEQGQHLTLKADVAGEELRRSYSICSAVQDNCLRVAVKRVAGGKFSNWINDELKAGMDLEVMAPSGRFRSDLAEDNEKSYVAFAAGSGITPILSIIKTTLMAEPKSRFTLVYGNRSASSVLFKEELEDLKDRYLDRFRIIFILSREELDIELFHGRIDRERIEALLKTWIDPKDIDMSFSCGPLSMMQDVKNVLIEHGVPRESIKQEMFATSVEEASARADAGAAEEARALEGTCEVSVVLEGRRRSFAYDNPKLSLLDAAAEHGIELPFSCKAGVCSTCRCKVTEGEIDMNAAYALEDYEIERGFALSCQSFPLSDTLTLDFDQET
ncbi:MAG: phenylacetic acid degradation protein [Salinisphaeraceae bacterium]|jgi:ring-1,2-phenylacetyl-CoA epoxidase subunit PaaE|nr:phenylacetic acid degradation protein [Salinisphaeraceae bacterium]